MYIFPFKGCMSTGIRNSCRRTFNKQYSCISLTSLCKVCVDAKQWRGRSGGKGWIGEGRMRGSDAATEESGGE